MHIYIYTCILYICICIDTHANWTMTPTTVSSIAMYPYGREYVKDLFQNHDPGKAPTPKCLKNDKNPHDCDCAL